MLLSYKAIGTLVSPKDLGMGKLSSFLWVALTVVVTSSSSSQVSSPEWTKESWTWWRSRVTYGEEGDTVPRAETDVRHFENRGRGHKPRTEAATKGWRRQGNHSSLPESRRNQPCCHLEPSSGEIHTWPLHCKCMLYKSWSLLEETGSTADRALMGFRLKIVRGSNFHLVIYWKCTFWTLVFWSGRWFWGQPGLPIGIPCLKTNKQIKTKK